MPAGDQKPGMVQTAKEKFSSTSATLLEAGERFFREHISATFFIDLVATDGTPIKWLSPPFQEMMPIDDNDPPEKKNLKQIYNSLYYLKRMSEQGLTNTILSSLGHAISAKIGAPNFGLLNLLGYRDNLRGLAESIYNAYSSESDQRFRFKPISHSSATRSVIST